MPFGKTTPKKSQPYPHNRARVRMLDHMTTVVGIVSPLMTIPQINQVWLHQNAVGVSLMTWSLLAVLKIPFIVYAVVHKDKAVAVSYSLFLVMNTAVAVGVFIFG